MIITEIVPDNQNLVYTYSSEGVKILQVETGIIYTEAVDLNTSNYTYTETDIPIEELEDNDILRIILGYEDNVDYPKNDDDLTNTEALNILLEREEQEDFENESNTSNENA